jgi:hypothetical protein
MWIFEIIGIVVTTAFALFFFLYFVYQLLKTEAEPVVSAESMPNLRPIPIPTKNCPRGMRVLIWFYEVRKWTLTDNWTYRLKDGPVIVLPAGFFFDGASIPRPFWAILNPIGLLLIPGLIHDYGYKYDQLWQLDGDGQVSPYGQGAGKAHWDRLFLDIGREVNGFRLINAVAWLAVALGGDAAWKAHRKNAAVPDRPETGTEGPEP